MPRTQHRRIVSSLSFLLLSLLLLGSGCAHQPAARLVPTPAGSLFVDDGGRGAIPVVFIHGNGGSGAQWRAQLSHLRATHRAIAIDLPGMGQSPAPANGDYSLDSMVAAIDATTRKLGLQRFVLIGHSYAGAIVATYAAQHPERVAGVVYVDAAGAGLTLTAEQKSQLLAALRANKMGVVGPWFAPMLKPSTPAVQEEVMNSVKNTSVEAFSSALFSLEGYDGQRVVNAYHGPRLAVAATDIESPNSFHKLFPDVPSVAVSGAGHWIMLDKPAELNAALDTFLDSLH
jgi:pimeloyl-ACP methyl ester carboxylesterase